MGMKLINVRGYRIAVESKSGSQTAFIRKQYEELSNERLAELRKETETLILETIDE